MACGAHGGCVLAQLLVFVFINSCLFTLLWTKNSGRRLFIAPNGFRVQCWLLCFYAGFTIPNRDSVSCSDPTILCTAPSSLLGGYWVIVSQLPPRLGMRAEAHPQSQLDCSSGRSHLAPGCAQSSLAPLERRLRQKSLLAIE